MNYLLSILSFVMLNFCSNNKNPETINQIMAIEIKDSTNFLGNSTEYESIAIKYWDSYNGNMYELKFEDEQLNIYCNISGIEFTVYDKNKKNLFITLVKQLYIEKTDAIVLAKVKSEDALISNYSSIEVKVRDKRGISLHERTQIGSEEYEIEFNPKFIKLYELIQDLTSSCGKL